MTGSGKMTGVGPSGLANLLSQIRPARPPGDRHGSGRCAVHSQAQAPSVQRPACTVPVVASGGQERSRGRAGRLGRLGRPVLPPAVTVRPLLAGVATGFCPQGTGAGASPAPLQSVLVVCPWGGCHHRPHTAPQGSRGWTPAFSAAPAGPEEQGWAPRPLRGTVPTAVCSQHPSPLAELKGRASLGKRRPPHAPCWAPGMQARARGGPMCRTQEACRTRSRGAGSDISCGLEGLLVWAGEWAWEGHPAQAGGEVTGRVGIQAGQTGHWGWVAGRRRCLAGIRHGGGRGGGRPAWDVPTVACRRRTALLALARPPPGLPGSLSRPPLRADLSQASQTEHPASSTLFS